MGDITLTGPSSLKLGFVKGALTLAFQQCKKVPGELGNDGYTHVTEICRYF